MAVPASPLRARLPPILYTIGMKNAFTDEISAGILSQLVNYLKCRGISALPLLSEFGIDIGILEQPDTRIPAETYFRVEREAIRRSGDPDFGLHMGECFEPGNYSIVSFMMMNCRTLGEALVKAARYERLIGTLVQGKAKFGLKTGTITYPDLNQIPWISRHFYESVFSSMTTMVRKLTGMNLSPIEIGFSHPQPDSISEHQRIFRSKILFNRMHNYITFDIRAGTIPLAQPNEQLMKYFEQYAHALLARIDTGKTATCEVKRLLIAHLDRPDLSIAFTARKMACSIRSLQNRLKDEGTQFRNLLIDTRKEVAENSLRQKMPLAGITYILGYSDVSVFCKAFKQWTGMTPGEYRTKIECEP